MIGNARIYYSDSRSTAVRQTQEVRPEFGFGNHDQFRPQQSQIRPDRKAEIHGKVENVLFAEMVARQPLTSVSCGRDYNSMLGVTLPQFRDQTPDRHHFTD